MSKLDNGCDHHDDCFTCPFEDCIDGLRGKTIISEARHKAILQMFRDGKEVKDIAEAMKLSHRSVYRIIRVQRGATVGASTRHFS